MNMEFLENQIRELESYLPPLTRRPDFDEFWERNLAASAALPLQAELKRREYPVPQVEVYDVYYTSGDGVSREHGLYILPAERQKKLPVMVHYHGYTGNCGRVSDFLPYVLMGIAVFSIDERAQNGEMTDCHPYQSGTMSLMTHGIDDPEDYYMKWAILDAVRALDFVLSRPEIGSDLVIVEGGSQGGAMSFTVACLDRRVTHCFCDVPSSTNIEKRVELAAGSFHEATDYIRRYPDKLETVYHTLSYFDTMNMAEKCTASVYASVGLKDTTCPARCYYAAYNRLNCPKQIAVFPFSGHEGGGSYYADQKLQLVAELLK